MATFPKLSYACPIPWDSMRGDEKERFCSKCTRTVVNISLLTEEQRVALLASVPPAELCVAYYRRLSGEFVSAEAPLKPSESRALVQFGATALALGAATLVADYAPTVGQTSLQAQQTIEVALEKVREDVADGSLQLLDRIAERFGAKKQPPVEILMGMIVCPPPPSVPAPAISPTP